MSDKEDNVESTATSETKKEEKSNNDDTENQEVSSVKLKVIK